MEPGDYRKELEDYARGDGRDYRKDVGNYGKTPDAGAVLYKAVTGARDAAPAARDLPRAVKEVLRPLPENKPNGDARQVAADRDGPRGGAKPARAEQNGKKRESARPARRPGVSPAPQSVKPVSKGCSRGCLIIVIFIIIKILIEVLSAD